MSGIKLQRVQISDADFMLKLVNDKQVQKYLPELILDEKMMKTWLGSLDDTACEFIIQLADSGTNIGECSLSPAEEGAEAGLMILPEYWNKGYGTETVEILLDMAKSFDHSKVTASTDKNNAAMIRILEKKGFTLKKEGFSWHISEEDPFYNIGTQIIAVYEKNLE